VHRSRDWFIANGLPAPALYVPPAWGVGKLSRATLHRAGFAQLETLGGITSVRTGKSKLLPLAGFEADTDFRAAFVRASNALNLVLARVTKRPIRVAVHPGDERLLLHRKLDEWIAKRWTPLAVDDVTK
jgi:predicted deacetylase